LSSGTEPRDIPATGHRLAIGVVALAAVGLLAWWASPDRGQSGTPTAAQADDDKAIDACILGMIESARDGDVDTYLDGFVGPLRLLLGRRLANRSTATAAAAELKQGTRDLQSFVTSDRVVQDEESVRLVLERVYPDRVDRHRVEVRRNRAGWKIVSLEPLDRVAPEIPFGTPVGPLPPRREDGEQEP